jgi:transposase InsO family protein
MNTPSSVFEIIHETLREPELTLSVTELCRLAGVSTSGYYNWVNSATKREEKEMADRKDFELIQKAYQFRGYQKGIRSIHMRLLHEGIQMNPKKISRLMHKYGLMCPIRKANPYRRMAKAMKTNHIAGNLLNREFESHGPRMVLLTDITYIRYNDTFAYLSTILDAFTKQVLSHVISPGLEVDFVLQTVHQLLEKHGVALTKETLIHSDQGSHYTSLQFVRLVKDSNLRQSMSRRGNCWDNAPQESFFGHMKDELADKIKTWECFEDVKRDVDDWIDYYNNDRYQWPLAKLSPNQYYDYITTGEYPLSGLLPEPSPRGSAP